MKILVSNDDGHLAPGLKILVENLKMMSGNYDVSVSSKSISHFQNTKLPIQYWIALEPDSTISK